MTAARIARPPRSYTIPRERTLAIHAPATVKVRNARNHRASPASNPTPASDAQRDCGGVPCGALRRGADASGASQRMQANVFLVLALAVRAR
jgi:hypothetical protein